MKKIVNICCLLLLVMATLVTACKKTKVGYLSDDLSYIADTLLVKQGQSISSRPIVKDHSTQPMTVTLLNVRNKATGQREEAFFKKYYVQTWKSAFNPAVDTTLALFAAKRDSSLMTPISINSTSGTIILNGATQNIPTGYYLLDVEVENENSKKQYYGICTIKIIPSTIEINSVPYFIAVKAGTESGIRFYQDDQWINPNLGQGTSASLNVRKIANSPDQIVFKIIDKDGKVLPGNAAQNRPNGNSFFNNLRVFGYKTTVTDTAVLYNYFPTSRFPDQYWDSQTNNVYNYFRIYNDNIASIDTADTRNWFPPVTTPYGTWNKYPVNLNVRFSAKIDNPKGKYLFELKLKATKK